MKGAFWIRAARISFASALGVVSLHVSSEQLEQGVTYSPTKDWILVEKNQLRGLTPERQLGDYYVVRESLMADLSKVRVRALVDEIDVGKVSIGQVVSIKVAAYRDQEFFGTVSKIEPKAKIDQNVTTLPRLIDIENDENLLLLGMNTDVIIEVLNKDVSISAPTMSLRTRKDIYSAAAILNIPKDSVDIFLQDFVEGENFNKYIVIKDSKKGPKLTWVKIGSSDLSYVEIISGLDINDKVFILPSKSLFDYQMRFKERVQASFSFG